jgi:diguanylate cyclase (GGDEF)-like protein
MHLAIDSNAPAPSVVELLRPVWPTGAILAAAVFFAWLGKPLPQNLVGLATLGPYALLGVAAAVGFWFNRERVFVLALSILAAFAACTRIPSPLVHTVLAILVPLNALFALAVTERGARFGGAWRWLALLALEVAALHFLRKDFDPDLLDNWLLRAQPTPLAARIAFAAAFAAAAWRAWPNHTPVEVGVGGALVAFFVACTWVLDERIFALFVTAAAAMLVAAVLQESHRLAFRDGLTGLPNRRALEELLRALQPPYTVAMVDVDHFKKFNDAHGHDIGDQVLKLVASRLAESSGDGRAYRYGGEEFTVVFPGQHLQDALPKLEAARAAVEAYKMTVRGGDRPKDKREGAAKRREEAKNPDFARTDMILSVTVSVGVAEPGKRMKTTAEVVKGADEALYRAKERGRNRVSR